VLNNIIQQSDLVGFWHHFCMPSALRFLEIAPGDVPLPRVIATPTTPSWHCVAGCWKPLPACGLPMFAARDSRHCARSTSSSMGKAGQGLQHALMAQHTHFISLSCFQGPDVSDKAWKARSRWRRFLGFEAV
jgi:hypothetical protein